MGTKKKTMPATPSNGRKYRKIDTSLPTAHDWGEENDGPPLECHVREARDIKTRHGVKRAFTVTTDDGEILLIWEKAMLRPLSDLVGQDVRIIPMGFGEAEGKKNAPRLFDIEVAE